MHDLFTIIFIQNGNTALMEASENGQTAVVKALVDNGAGIEKQNKVCALRMCKTPMYFTCYNGSYHTYPCQIRKDILLSTKQATMDREE